MNWYEVEKTSSLDTPALLVYPDRIQANIDRAIAIVGDVDRLRPHAKTHKMLEVARMKVAAGIKSYKCATIAEAEMMARAGATDILIAYQLLGPRISQLRELSLRFNKCAFSSLVDSREGVDALIADAREGVQHMVYIDVNVGQNRTGIKTGPALDDLIVYIQSQSDVQLEGFHAYDGHVTEPDLEFRTDDCENALRSLFPYLDRDQSLQLIAGGSPTFIIHAQHQDRQCSPGTFVFWDQGYQSKYPEYEFHFAAVVATRIISRIDKFTYCLDLGYKHIAAEGVSPQITFLNTPDYRQMTHSEEHLVVRFRHEMNYAIGDVLYGIPRHICPTVALYNKAQVVQENIVVDTWEVAARNLIYN